MWKMGMYGNMAKREENNETLVERSFYDYAPLNISFQTGKIKIPIV
jgi:hypothetical protein